MIPIQSWRIDSHGPLEWSACPTSVLSSELNLSNYIMQTEIILETVCAKIDVKKLQKRVCKQVIFISMRYQGNILRSCVGIHPYITLKLKNITILTPNDHFLLVRTDVIISSYKFYISY